MCFILFPAEVPSANVRAHSATSASVCLLVLLSSLRRCLPSEPRLTLEKLEVLHALDVQRLFGQVWLGVTYCIPPHTRPSFCGNIWELYQVNRPDRMVDRGSLYLSRDALSGVIISKAEGEFEVGHEYVTPPGCSSVGSHYHF